MANLISVIVPIYNVEKYLVRCIDSIISQTYKNIEIILVNDGSPDNCGSICDKYAQQDARIRVLHKKNGGLSDARNCGVEVASGEYITFIDSDDFIAPNYIEYLYNLLIENDADISCCCSIKTGNDSVKFGTDNTTHSVQVLSGEECCYALFGNLYLTLVTAWGKLYKSKVVKKYPFPIGRKHEDEATTCKYYYDAKKVVVSNAQLYAYYQNPTGIMNSLGKGINYDFLWAFEHRALFFQEKNALDLTKISWRNLFYSCVRKSMENDGCYDEYLKTFGIGKRLTRQVKYELKLYNISPKLFKFYRDSRHMLGKIKRLIKNRGRK